jgi:hypothetical protein
MNGHLYDSPWSSCRFNVRHSKPKVQLTRRYKDGLLKKAFVLFVTLWLYVRGFGFPHTPLESVPVIDNRLLMQARFDKLAMYSSTCWL